MTFLTPHTFDKHFLFLLGWTGGPEAPSGEYGPCGSVSTDLQSGDGLVRVHQVWHDGLQRAMPLASGPGTRTGVWPELTHLLMVGLLAVVECQQAAGR